MHIVAHQDVSQIGRGRLNGVEQQLQHKGGALIIGVIAAVLSVWVSRVERPLADQAVLEHRCKAAAQLQVQWRLACSQSE